MDRDEELKQAFASSDSNGDGKLSFDEFYALLQKGDPEFPSDGAEELFKVADRDLSGYIDFKEFVDYIYGNKDLENLIDAQIDQAAEDDAKKIVLSKSLMVRSGASKAVQAKGGNWSKLSWRERLSVVLVHEEEGEIPREPSLTLRRRTECPTPSPTTETKRKDTDKRNSMPAPPPCKDTEKMSTVPSTPSRSKSMFVGDVSKSVEDDKDSDEDDDNDQPPMTHAKTEQPKKVTREQTKILDSRTALAQKTQEELVDFSIHVYDLNFAGRDPDTRRELVNFREHLKTAGGPLELIDIRKFIAKGTAGWVFLAERKSSGSKVAMKMIRMTQALSGIKEWYVSKILRKAGITNIVFTDEQVCVFARSDVPPVIEETLKDAGPVPYYLCLIQDFMTGGTLEGLAENGQLTPRMMFQALEDVASTLAMMHSRNVHHKDVKPENVLVDMNEGALVSAKLCDFGSAEIGKSDAARADDIRRFGVTLFSLATGEGWTKNRLIREEHKQLVLRLEAFVKNASEQAMRDLPSALREILGGKMMMPEVAKLMTKFKEACT